MTSKTNLSPQSSIGTNNVNNGKVPTDSFIIVKHGMDENVIFNYNCKIKFLLLNLRERCNIKEKERVVDLCDLDGNLLNIRDEATQNRYGVNTFQPRQICVLIEVIKPSEGGGGEDRSSSLKYIPLLENREIVNEYFLNKLSPKSGVPTRSTTRNRYGSTSRYSRSNSIVSLNSANLANLNSLSEVAMVRSRAQSIVSANANKLGRKQSAAAVNLLKKR